MRELIFKNLYTPKSRKREVSVEEVVEKNGLISTTKKRSMYFVRGGCHMESQKKMQEWVANRKKNPALDKKFFHILRQYSAKSGEDKLICKMRGSFCIISDQDVYNIVFVHAIKISIQKSR